ncbi:MULTISPECIES: RbsD/FucU family protein [Fictibacillus]|uniref:Fucose isomerase n=1 Tax=Fictibacillus enclensis TaxID=1017270 RepID=A0A0V8J262_9BACL|nr:MULTISPECIES: RbsD/FucU domain-containing protein [Fictibacillus]KSU81110.1 fucose isomerase [Fictibacillus enclensis]RXZ00639.1 fucose isomerase [Fictibacillus sp. S7]
MLKGIPSILSPELLKVLMEMGHGDEIVIADGNFPAASHARRLVPGYGHGVCDFLRAILDLFPLDTYVDAPVLLMDPVEGDDKNPQIWKEFERAVQATNGDKVSFEKLERHQFYERSKEAYAVLATSEHVPYANIILKKGVLDQ